MDIFAPNIKQNTSFIVQNKSPQIKTINIFNYPINYGQSRDLLQIPGISEQSIRSSLLKGELNHKIRSGDILITFSDIDLTQYNTSQLSFLQNAGVINGLQIGSGQITTELSNKISGGGTGGITTSQHETLRQLIHFIDEGPGDGFASGAYKVISPVGPFPSTIIWYVDNTQTKIIVSKTITYNSNKFPTTIVWNMYDFDGITIVHTVTDTIAYNSAFESTRTRTIT